MVASIPPPYPSSLNLPPTYHPRPLPAEQSLLAGAVPPPEGVLSFPSKHFAVALTGQPEREDSEERLPEYGRNAVLQGAVEMSYDGSLKPQEVAKVRVKIEGKLKLEIAEGGNHSLVFIEEEIILYPPENSDAPCPSILPFSYHLPTHYLEEQPHPPNVDPPKPIKRSLPPSYECAFNGVPGLRAQVRYLIKVEVVRKKLWKRTYSLPIKFIYRPRSRPHLPGPPPNASFLATLKQSPEEWAVFSNAVPRRNDPTNLPGVPPVSLEQTLQQEGETILSTLVLPATQTFPLSQQIPVHLQLSVCSNNSNTPKTASHPTDHQRRPSTAPNTNISSQAASKEKRSRSQSDSNVPGSSASASASSSNLLSLFYEPCFIAPPSPGQSSQSSSPTSSTSGHNSRPPLNRNDTSDGSTSMDHHEAPEPISRPGMATRSSSGSGSRESSSSSSSASSSIMKGKDNGNTSYIRVSLQRQIVVTVRGQKVVKTVICGDARLQRVSLSKDADAQDPPPPSILDSRCPTENSHQSSIPQPTPSERAPEYTAPDPTDPNSIAWEGYVIPSKDILSVGGFRTQGLWVKDFITLTMVPPNPEKSPLRALHHAVPIRLVSDPWEEEWWGVRRF